MIEALPRRELQARGSRVFVLAEEARAVTAGGVILPDKMVSEIDLDQEPDPDMMYNPYVPEVEAFLPADYEAMGQWRREYAYKQAQETRNIAQAIVAEGEHLWPQHLFRDIATLPQRGVIAGIGPGTYDADGNFQGTRRHPGEEVCFASFAGEIIDIDADRYLLMDESDILLYEDRGSWWLHNPDCVLLAHQNPAMQTPSGLLATLHHDIPRFRGIVLQVGENVDDVRVQDFVFFKKHTGTPLPAEYFGLDAGGYVHVHHKSTIFCVLPRELIKA
jgi:co-chaperonin GroES (HSP10)